MRLSLRAQAAGEEGRSGRAVDPLPRVHAASPSPFFSPPPPPLESHEPLSPRLFRRIHDGQASGVMFQGNSEGRLEDCEVFANQGPGIFICDGDLLGRRPTVVNCKYVPLSAGAGVASPLQYVLYHPVCRQFLPRVLGQKGCVGKFRVPRLRPPPAHGCSAASLLKPGPLPFPPLTLPGPI